MLRSVLDTIRGAGDAVDEEYQASAIRSTLHQSELLSELSASQLETLAAASTLLMPDSDEISDETIYAEAATANALYLVRAGTISSPKPRPAASSSSRISAAVAPLVSRLDAGAVADAARSRLHLASQRLSDMRSPSPSRSGAAKPAI